VKLARFRKTKVACFLLYVEDTSKTNISIMIYTYKYTQNMFLKVVLLEETKEGREKKSILGLESWLKWQNTCLASIRPLV
jgi:hypothetical protein